MPQPVPPRCRLPEPGAVLHLRAGDCRYHDEPMTLRVHRARPELSVYYDGDWLWLEGWRLGDHGFPGRFLQVLVRVDAINRNDGPPDHST